MRQFAYAMLALIASAGLALAKDTDQDIRLVMVDQPGCAYCAAWDDEIGPAYPNTAEGKFAPLMRADLHVGPPDGIKYARRVNFTPTFILLEGNNEVARIEGYPGEDFFWPILAKLLQDHTAFQPATN
ncbi:thioredoxin family protein [uncultured Pelagimonas sp.]|uniref:thioredoxin family protein n=1 Tax=uncultured Pelagimonas sp. TaxID=1618102 RepID=UPI00261A6A89|nr:thioredoxin family protein [uncultured Pelagimonas sp.]